MITVAEIARASGRSPDIIRRWLRCGRLTGVQTRSGAWLVSADAIAELQTFPRTHRRRPVI
jgi:predicted site-specific integrase-resolvase